FILSESTFLEEPVGEESHQHDGGGEDGEPVAPAGVDGAVGDEAEAGVGRGLDMQRERAAKASGGVDGGGDAVVGGAQDPAAVFGGAHAHDAEMLLARGALAEPA